MTIPRTSPAAPDGRHHRRALPALDYIENLINQARALRLELTSMAIWCEPISESASAGVAALNQVASALEQIAELLVSAKARKRPHRKTLATPPSSRRATPMTEPQLPFDPPLPARPGQPMTLCGVPCRLIEFPPDRRRKAAEFAVDIERYDDSLSPEIKRKLFAMGHEPPKYYSSAAKAIDREAIDPCGFWRLSVWLRQSPRFFSRQQSIAIWKRDRAPSR
jgi:hypothetical protein